MQITRFHFPRNEDADCQCGVLIAIEGAQNIPFPIRRVFYIYGVTGDISRGAHAHIASNQILICLHGSCEIILDDGMEREAILLDDPAVGILQHKGIWGEMRHFSKDAVLMVLSDTHYDPNDYIHDYAQFIAMKKELS
jgi:dTDP-4-dehydrorhamnose 3,5-epimerase-like enzyme